MIFRRPQLDWAGRPSAAPRRGVVLLAVLVVLVLLTLAAYQYNELMMAENRASYSYTQSLQARALADSGVHYVAGLLSDPTNITNLGGNLFDNPTVFQNIAVATSNSTGRGRFSIVALTSLAAPDDVNSQSQPYYFGLIDEAGKINLNALMLIDPSGNTGYNILMTLPNMTQDIANSILDWLDPDDTPRTAGAENDYYSSLDPPYQCKNGPLDSLEELLLVKGVTPQLLFGNDRNRNGVLDPGEDDGTGSLDQGWSAYLTVYSREPNTDINGNARIYLNDSDLNNLYTNLSTATTPDLANFIIAVRMYGMSTPGPTVNAITPNGATTTKPATGAAARPATGAATPGGNGAARNTSPTGFQKLSDADASTAKTQITNDRTTATPSKRTTRISSVYSLINAQVNIPTGTGANAKTITMTSPLSDPSQQAQLLPMLFDSTTTSQATDLPPRVNVLTASQTVLQALPGLSDADVQNILEQRPDPTANTTPDAVYQTPAWLLTQANLSVTTLQSLENYITSRSQVYRFQVVGYFEGGGPVSRVEAIVDANNGRPRIVYKRDLSALGKAFDLNLMQNN
jgi:type II secretory pathway component PulK